MRRRNVEDWSNSFSKDKQTVARFLEKLIAIETVFTDILMKCAMLPSQI
jgi:hypothetical protein